MRDKTAVGNNENLFLSFAQNDITAESGCVEHLVKDGCSDA